MMKIFERGKLKRAQEEMVGFVVIVVIVSVVILVLLGFLLRSPDTNAVENYEIESFIQASLQYTSDCKDYLEFLAVDDLIILCQEGGICGNGQNSCEVLNNTLRGLIETSWTVSNQSAVKGYKFDILAEEEGMLMLEKGNKTGNYKGAFQAFAKRGNDYEVSLKIYS
jgi:hypothetical protein